MAVGRVTGRFNHEGDLAPLTSPWGRELFSATPKLIDQPAPLVGWRWSRFVRGNIGGFFVRAANVGLVQSSQGYSGDMPLSQQEYVSAPPPWERP